MTRVVSDTIMGNSPVILGWLAALSVLVLALFGVVIWLAVRDVSATASGTSVGGIALPSDTGNGETLALCRTGNGTIGPTEVDGWTYDDCDSLYIVTSRFVTPGNLSVGRAVRACAYIGQADAANGDKFKLAIYNDDGFGIPTTLRASTGEGTIEPESWNCLSISTPLGESQLFWLALITNGQECGAMNNLYYQSHLQLRSGFTYQFLYPDWPAQMPELQYFSAVYGMYVDYNATCIGPF